MLFPAKMPGLRPFLWLFFVYTAVWISLEGVLWRVVVMGVGVTAVTVAFLLQRTVGGKHFSVVGFVVLVTAAGLLFGVLSSLFTLIFMAIKTGLHAHGPEFTRAELVWVWRHLPVWAVAGGFAGGGLGLVLVWLRD
ncbi:MAG: hypothetical protein Kow0080_06050 [Candidatus Promineifilaceae bacterium]